MLCLTSAEHKQKERKDKVVAVGRHNGNLYTQEQPGVGFYNRKQSSSTSH